MKAPFLRLLALLLIATGTGILLVRDRTGGAGRPIYSVGQVEAGLQRQPQAWLGKTVTLRALVVPAPLPCCCTTPASCAPVYRLLGYPASPPAMAVPTLAPSPRTLRLPRRRGDQSVTFIPSVNLLSPSLSAIGIYFSATGLASHLFLRPEPDAFLNRLRSIPGIGQLLPAPQPVFGGDLYRVTIEPAPATSFCPQAPCYWAVLADAQLPGDIGLARPSRWRLPGHLHPR